MSLRKNMAILLAILIIFSLLSPVALAEDSKTAVIGKVYSFDKKSNYDFLTSKDYVSSDKAETYGDFSISGNICNISTKDGVPSYEIESDSIQVFYTYGDTKLEENNDDWYLIKDKEKNIGEIKLEDKIKKGAVILQVSKDRINWSNVVSDTNVFEDVPIQTKSLYESKDIELLNGCFYRFIVVYKTERLIEEKKVLFVSVKDYEENKIAEVYEFYAFSSDGNITEKPEETHSLGSKVRTEKFDGYAGQVEITKKKDAHYGWDIGNFYVSGYTSKCKDENENFVFLKNVGDKVTLWFDLTQNIDAIQGDTKLTITADEEGYDEYFETPMMDFGRGTLIVRYTDYNGNKSEPQIYTNYLEANATIGADTVVQLFEEGDYEIALDYELTDNKLIDSIGHYRIFFKFSVRNGNCMVYPFDIKNGNELTNSSMTDNGFKLDLAKSRYLIVNVKREILTETADGLVEDTRFNGPAKDGAEYTEDGIYTITVQNQYTNQFTTKKIYVGTNKILKAYMTTGLSIAEINNLVANGATISDEGLISLSTNSTVVETTSTPDVEMNDTKTATQYDVIVVVSITSFICVVALLVIIKRKKKCIQTNSTSEGDDVE